MSRLRISTLERLTGDIEKGVLRPGERLCETALAERYEVSRTPVREALLILAATGKVVKVPNKGCVVACGPAD